jgi:hypothetical protein
MRRGVGTGDSFRMRVGKTEGKLQVVRRRGKGLLSGRERRSDHAGVGIWRVRVNGWAVWHLNPAIWEAIAGTGRRSGAVQRGLMRIRISSARSEP